MNSEDVRSFALFAILLFIIIYIILYMWSFYNKKRFGNLKRRKHPIPTTKEDMLNLKMINESTYEELQNIKEINFEENPIKRENQL